MSYNAQTYETPTTISPEPAHQDKRSVVIPFEPTAPSHTSSVLDAIEQSGMPLPTQEARSKRPTPPQRRYRVQRVNAILQHVEHPWMLANLDREVVGNDAVQILECKTAGIYGAKLWKEGVPEYVQLQVMHQLAVTGQQAADVAVLLGGHELQIHRIERDEAMIDQLIALERHFWNYVESDTPPPADGSDSADQALRALFPQDDGETIDLCHDVGLSQAFADLQRVRHTLDAAKKEEAKLKHKLQQAMGTATLATFPSGVLSWKQTKPVNRLDTKTLQKEHPALCAAYLHSHPGTRRLVVR